MASVLPTEVVEAAVTVCGRAFHLKDPLRALMIAQGVPTQLWDRYAGPGVNKFVIARNVFGDLRANGPASEQVLRKVITELANMTRPHESVENKAVGQRALDELRQLATARRILQDPEAIRRVERERQQEQRAQARSRRAARLAELSRRVADLRKPGQEPQARGYGLERILVDLFDLSEMEYRPSYRTAHEQIDAAFDHRGFQYLVEARWRSIPPDIGDLADFKFKVDGKLDSTRGMFLSMVGFDEEIVGHFMTRASGTRNNLILFSGQDLAMVLEGGIDLREALDYKIGKASQEGRWWAPLAGRF